MHQISHQRQEIWYVPSPGGFTINIPYRYTSLASPIITTTPGINSHHEHHHQPPPEQPPSSSPLPAPSPPCHYHHLRHYLYSHSAPPIPEAGHPAAHSSSAPLAAASRELDPPRPVTRTSTCAPCTNIYRR
ncbi:hypothetical protein M752DRAFT_148561 [Aspergillus phoenicis ATCC 13157]|uniref:Uncharacterized protein n=1 Tax=Aspergillus phoenicis ATCC 13157 TaxID=1353007 RepID=A0A370PP79_ASPPH|nr:hypothetical protein M752DRAFT_148561 [Aspergillus phoenicis ATCC 13157]